MEIQAHLITCHKKHTRINNYNTSNTIPTLHGNKRTQTNKKAQTLRTWASEGPQRCLSRLERPNISTVSDPHSKGGQVCLGGDGQDGKQGQAHVGRAYRGSRWLHQGRIVERRNPPVYLIGAEHKRDVAKIRCC